MEGESSRIGGIGESVEMAEGRISGKVMWWVYIVDPYGHKSYGTPHETEESARRDYDRRRNYAASPR